MLLVLREQPQEGRTGRTAISLRADWADNAQESVNEQRKIRILALRSCSLLLLTVDSRSNGTEPDISSRFFLPGPLDCANVGAKVVLRDRTQERDKLFLCQTARLDGQCFV